jgi:hypothetical protein
MTDERLEEIRQHAANGFDTPSFEAEELIAEVDRLRSKLSAERGRLNWVAHFTVVWPDEELSGWFIPSRWVAVVKGQTMREAIDTAMGVEP